MKAPRKSRSRSAKPWAYKLPPDAPAYCATLDGMDEAEAREIITPGRRFGIGPKAVLAAGGCHAAVTCDGSGQPFKVVDWRGDPAGTFASWPPAADRMARVAAAHEAGLEKIMGGVP